MFGQTEQNLFGDDSIISSQAESLFKIVFDLPINWVGNKKRMMDRLLFFINNHKVEHDSFLDVFAGSGVVSLLAAASGKKVISNDLLMLSTTWLMQILSGHHNPLSLDEVLEIVRRTKELKGSPLHIGFLSEVYNGALLTGDEVAFLDAYRKSVADMFGDSMSIGHQLFNNTIQPAFLNLKTGQVTFDSGSGCPEKVTFAMQMMCIHILQQAFMGGRCYKSQLLAISEKRLKDGKIGRDGNSNAIGNENHLIKLLHPKTCPTRPICDFLNQISYSSTITNCDAAQLLSSDINADVAYFDPPYGGYNSDYAWMYRICEEFLMGKRLEDCDELREASVKFKGGDYERDKTFAKKARLGYTENFALLLNQSKKFPHWLVSFNESSFASIEDIIEIITAFRKDVIVETVDGYRYNYRDKSAKAGSEYIILARSS